jgi:hypothetical protein
MAREAAESILRDIENRLDNDYYDENCEEDEGKQREIILSRYAEIILGHLKSHSIPLPKGENVSTEDPKVAERFLAKYAELVPLVECAKAEALRRWPGTTFTLSVTSDPESCHVCCEGQHLTLMIHTGLEWSLEEKSPWRLADDAWMDWICGDGTTYSEIEDSVGDARLLFRTELVLSDRSP